MASTDWLIRYLESVVACLQFCMLCEHVVIFAAMEAFCSFVFCRIYPFLFLFSQCYLIFLKCKDLLIGRVVSVSATLQPF
jgi:hypothetical protein